MKKLKLNVTVLVALAVFLFITVSQSMAAQMMQMDKSKMVVKPQQVQQQAEQKLSSDPAKLNFGKVNVEEVSAYQKVVIVNSGSAAVDMGLVLADADKESFKLGSGTCLNNTTLQPGESCNVTIAFAPKVAGDKQAKLSRSANPPLLNIPLTGTGVAKQATQTVAKTEAPAAQKAAQAEVIKPAKVTQTETAKAAQTVAKTETSTAQKVVQAEAAKPTMQPFSVKAPITEALIKTMTKEQLEALPDDQLFEFKDRKATKKQLKQEHDAKLAAYRSKAKASISANPEHKIDLAAMNVKLKQEHQQKIIAAKAYATSPQWTDSLSAVSDISITLPPKIDKVLSNTFSFSQGSPLFIYGSGFGKDNGKVWLKLQTKVYDISKNTNNWSDRAIGVYVPEWITEPDYSSAYIYVETSKGQESNHSPSLKFESVREIKQLYATEIDVKVESCPRAKSSGHDWCRDRVSPGVAETISGYHSATCSWWLVDCPAGAHNTDIYSAKLKNGWVFKKVEFQTYSNSSAGALDPRATYSGFTEGSYSLTLNVNWKLGYGTTEEVGYDLSIFIEGPVGVPYK